MAFRVIVDDDIVSVFKNKYTYDKIGYGSVDLYTFKENAIDFPDISAFLSFIGIYCQIALSLVPGQYEDLNSSYTYVDGVCVIYLQS